MQAYFRSGACEASLNDSLEALTLDNTSTKAFLRASLSYLMLNQPSKAIPHLLSLESAGAPGGTSDAKALLQRALDYSRHQLLVKSLEHGQDATAFNASWVAKLRESLQELWADAEGDIDADIPQCLRNITEALHASPHARALFELENGYRLLWFYFVPAHCEIAAEVLRAAATPGIFWPEDTWRRLLATAAGGKTENNVAKEAMQLITWAARVSPSWVKCQVLVHPLLSLKGNFTSDTAPAADLRNSAESSENRTPETPLGTIIRAMRSTGTSSKGPKLTFEALKVAADLLKLFGQDPGGVNALRALGAEPLQALLTPAAAASDIAVGVASNSLPSTGNAKQTKTNQPLRSPSQQQNIRDDNPLSLEEQEALEALREKQRAIFDATAVDLRRTLLSTLGVLCSHRDLVLDEAIIRSDKTPKKAKGGPLVPAMLSLLRKLVESAPKRTAPVLGPDGFPAAYAKRPFAADWEDNPTGDFLAHMDLSGRSTHNSSTAPQTDIQPGPTQLELLLEALLPVSTSSNAVATLLYQNGVLELCGRLCSFLTPSVVAAGQQIAAAVCQRCPAALDEVIQQSSIPVLIGLAKYSLEPRYLLAAFDKIAVQVDACSGDDFAVLTAPEGVLNPAFRTAQDVSDAKVSAAGARLLRACAERALRAAQSQGQIQASSVNAVGVPAGGGWAELDRSALQQILNPPMTQENAVETGKEINESLAKLKKGFFETGGKKTQAGKGSSETSKEKPSGTKQAIQQAQGVSTPELGVSEPVPTSMTSASSAGSPAGHGTREKSTTKILQGSDRAPSEVHHYSGGVTIEDITETQLTSQQAPQHPSTSPAPGAPHSIKLSRNAHTTRGPSTTTTATDQETITHLEDITKDSDLEEDCISDLRDVYDSSPTDATLRQIRAAWLAIPPTDRMRFEQTSADVSIWVTVPVGTSAREISVEVTPSTLTVSLKWYGKVLHGELFAGVKSKESTWCLENSAQAAEVHVVLPKVGSGSWWKAAMAGGKEKGYYELLQDAVQSDEPTQAYDEMDHEAKELLESLLDRQACVNAGLIDLENGFDDFRVVLGESSLGLGGASAGKSANERQGNSRGPSQP